jgi:hypothetical protein
LKERLHPVTPPDPHRLRQLLADLDSADFSVRQKAGQELLTLGESAEPGLRQALQGKPSLEVRQRLERLLETLERTTKLRALRAVEVLEAIGSPEARRLLETLSEGMPEARLTREAMASLERMAKRLAAASQ